MSEAGGGDEREGQREMAGRRWSKLAHLRRSEIRMKAGALNETSLTDDSFTALCIDRSTVGRKPGACLCAHPTYARMEDEGGGASRRGDVIPDLIVGMNYKPSFDPLVHVS